MKILGYRDADYGSFVKRLGRRALPTHDVRDLVSEIIAAVAAQGDKALTAYAKRFDNVVLKEKQLFVTPEELAAVKVKPATRKAVAASLKNIIAFAKGGLRKDWSMINAEGARVGERFQPFDRVGVYVPGGKAPLVSTALMTAGFAKAAGVPEILAATPCGPDGSVNPELLYALKAAGVPRFGYGAFVTAIVNFLILAFIIFWLVKIANRAIGARPEPAAGPTEEVLLLREIRDALRHKD